jgi:hypothetical protein
VNPNARPVWTGLDAIFIRAGRSLPQVEICGRPEARELKNRAVPISTGMAQAPSLEQEFDQSRSDYKKHLS